MQLKPLFAFLADLADHNQRDWFQDHKTGYQQLRAQFEADVDFWHARLIELDPVLGGQYGRKSIFRINRDVRFGHNKDPYKTHFSAYFTASPGKDVDAPAYYIQIGPRGQTLIAGGLYQPDKRQVTAVRQEIDYDAGAFRDILADANFRYFFADLSGEQLKRPPVGFPATHPDLDLLKHKNYIVAHEMTDAAALAEPDFRTYVLAAFRELVPFCQYLRAAIHH
jgi:uncharacterized protein (TIGR02453 family)